MIGWWIVINWNIPGIAWGRFARILSSEKADTKAIRSTIYNLYRCYIQPVLLIDGSES